MTATINLTVQHETFSGDPQEGLDNLDDLRQALVHVVDTVSNFSSGQFLTTSSIVIDGPHLFPVGDPEASCTDQCVALHVEHAQMRGDETTHVVRLMYKHYDGAEIEFTRCDCGRPDCGRLTREAARIAETDRETWVEICDISPFRRIEV